MKSSISTPSCLEHQLGCNEYSSIEIDMYNSSGFIEECNQREVGPILLCKRGCDTLQWKLIVTHTKSCIPMLSGT